MRDQVLQGWGTGTVKGATEVRKRQEAKPPGTQERKGTAWRTRDFLPRVTAGVQQMAVVGCDPGKWPGNRAPRESTLFRAAAQVSLHRRAGVKGSR